MASEREADIRDEDELDSDEDLEADAPPEVTEELANRRRLKTPQPVQYTLLELFGEW